MSFSETQESSLRPVPWTETDTLLVPMVGEFHLRTHPIGLSYRCYTDLPTSDRSVDTPVDGSDVVRTGRGEE